MRCKRLYQCMSVCLTLMLYCGAGHACRMAPAGQVLSLEAQMRLATDVAVGQVISATPIGGTDVEYRLLTLERLAGEPGAVLTVIGRAADRRDQETTFHAHRDFAFWAPGGGRAMNNADCTMHQAFLVGSSYLIFAGTPTTRRSVEQIAMVDGVIDPDDQWLRYVREQLRQRAAPERAAAPTSEAQRPAYERIGRFIYAFHRFVLRDDLDRKTLAAHHAPADLVLRAGRLADAFDQIVAGNAAPDAALEATLDEARTVNTLLAAWKSDRGSGPAN